MSAISVKTPVFEGPLEVLLELIESRKLLINDITLAQVTDDYIARVSGMGELPLEEASSFVALAATLLLIKSRSLLPTLSLTQEETQSIDELERRLAQYQIVREAARSLGNSLRTAPALFDGTLPEREPVFMPDAHTTTEELKLAILRVIMEFPKAVATLPKVAVKKAISLEEMISKLADRVNNAIHLSFHEFAGHSSGAVPREKRYDIVVSFLALLELVKQGVIRAQQEGSFGDIMLETDAVTTPKYGN